MARAVAPVVGVAVLVALTVVAATLVGTVALAVSAPAEPVHASISLTVDAGTDRLTFAHRAGAPLNATNLSLRVVVDGDALTHQPPIPFFAARGYRSGPTGPFNSAADPTWAAGRTASIRIAATNDPPIHVGDAVTATIRRDGRTVARPRARAQ